MTKKRIHQLVHTLSYGDAISGEVLALKRCFSELGFESEIFAINIHPKLKSEAKFYEALPKNDCDLVILHYSLGSPLNEIYRSLTQTKRALIFHNLTPAHWFESVNPRIVEDINHGVRELPELCQISDCLLADSKFNASELKNIGFNAEVLELPIDPKRWNVESSPAIASLLQKDKSIQLIHVGRMAPNKCLQDIIKIFYFLHFHIEKNSRLWLVGIDIDTEVYSYSLKRLIYQLHLGDAVNIVNNFNDADIRALYENASAYVCMSEHEGFCLPVVEAMYFGLPVLAYASSALPDTVSYGGILAHEKRHAELAEVVYRMSTDLMLRTKLITEGQRRVEDFSYEKFSVRVKEIVTSLFQENVVPLRVAAS